jgi:hypothetical protein
VSALVLVAAGSLAVVIAVAAYEGGRFPGPLLAIALPVRAVSLSARGSYETWWTLMLPLSTGRVAL